MPIIQDHPLRLRRIQAGLSQAELARLAHVSRGTISALEEGRVRKPSASVLIALGQRSNIEPHQLQDELIRFYENPATLSRRATNTLALPPSVVSQYADFGMWRRDIAPTPTAFASLLRISRTTLARYEDGTMNTMPKSMVAAFLEHLGISHEYLKAVMDLDRPDSPVPSR